MTSLDTPSTQGSNRLLRCIAQVNGVLTASIGLFWLVAWGSGVAPQWAATMIIPKANMALAQLMGGLALFALARERVGTGVRTAACVFSVLMLFISSLTLSEHLFGWDLGIDQLIAKEPPGALGTASPGRIGPPGSLSVLFAGVGLLALAFRRQRIFHVAGLAICVVQTIPAVGYLYGVEDLFSRARLTGISWYTVVALMSLGLGLLITPPHREDGPIAVLLRDNPGGALMRWLVPAAILGPLALGYSCILGQRQGLFSSATASATLVIAVVLSFTFLLWIGSRSLSRSSAARDLAEIKLRESELFHRQTLESIPGMVFTTRPDGYCDYQSQQWVDYTGVPMREHLGDGWSKLLHPDDRPRAVAAWKEAVEGRAPYNLEYRVRRHDGEYEWFKVIGQPIKNESGKIARWFGVAANINEIKRAEATLRENEELFRVMFTQSTVGKAQVELASGIFFCVNPALCRMTGYTEDELIRMRFADLIHPDDRTRYLESFGSLDRDEVQVYESEQRCLRKDGFVIWTHVTLNLIRDLEDRPLRATALVQDITERKEAEAVLARGREELERLVAERTAKLQELVGELEHFSYTITHDMRAPLRAMQGFAELLSEATNGSNPEFQDYLQRIRTSAARMDLLITDALSYSKAVRRELTLAPVNLTALLRGMIDSYPEFRTGRAHIKLVGDIPYVMGNEAGLTQCFSNLLGNAVKFVQPGRMPEIRILAESRDGWVRVWVEDNGLGIPHAMKPRVFDMFARGHSNYPGTGIGLALVRKVVDRMGGRVGVESELGKGSRFWLELKPAAAKVAI